MSASIPLPQGAGPQAIPQDSSLASQTRLLQSTVEVVNEGEVFEFSIPTVRHEIRISSLIPRVRRAADPEAAGESMDGLDPAGYFYIRTVAFFLTCLKSTSAQWVFSPGPDGKPVMKWEEWPAAVTNRVLAISLEAQEAIARFHGSGTPDDQSAGGEALAG